MVFVCTWGIIIMHSLDIIWAEGWLVDDDSQGHGQHPMNDNDVMNGFVVREMTLSSQHDHSIHHIVRLLSCGLVGVFLEFVVNQPSTPGCPTAHYDNTSCQFNNQPTHLSILSLLFPFSPH